MSENVSNINLFSIKMNDGNETVLVSTDIKDNITFHIIGAGKMLFKIAEGIILRFLDNPIPVLQRRLAVRVFLNERSNSFMGNDMHTILYLNSR